MYKQSWHLFGSHQGLMMQTLTINQKRTHTHKHVHAHTVNETHSRN